MRSTRRHRSTRVEIRPKPHAPTKSIINWVDRLRQDECVDDGHDHAAPSSLASESVMRIDHRASRRSSSCRRTSRR
jgi:hypothetical protein